jgi:flagellar M-ring protein FliF
MSVSKITARVSASGLTPLAAAARAGSEAAALCLLDAVPAPTPRTPEQLNELRNMVVNALGISIPKNETATNFVSIQEVVFPSAENSLSTPVDKVTGYMEMARPIAALAIAAIVFAVFFFMLRRAKPEEISFELVDDAAMAANTKALADADDSQQFLPASKNLKVSPELLNSLIRQKPENVGATLREWLITKDES